MILQLREFCKSRGNSAALLLVLALFITLSFHPAFAAQTKFIPLKLEGTDTSAAFTQRVDKALQKALSGTDIMYLPRNRATEIVSYQKTWPPRLVELKTIAKTTNADSLAVGTITKLGGQYSIDVKLFDLLQPDSPKFYFQLADSEEELENALTRIAVEIKNYTEREFRIASIAPKGNARIDSGAILRKIKTKVGDTYDPAVLRSDLKSIYKMGYFNNVQIDVADSEKGKQIIFSVTEKPVIKSVIYEGISEVKEEDVVSAANIKEHFILNPAKITQARQAILQLYKTKGFYNSTVNSKISYPDDQGAVVVFTIEEGQKIYIKEITVEGNKAFDDDELLKQIETGERWFMSWITDSGLLDMTRIRQDTQRIVAFYNDNGYLDAKVGEPIIKQKKEWLYLRFVVEEGTRYRVGQVDIAGDILGDKQALLDQLKIRGEKYISRRIIRDDIMKLTDYFAEKGYAFSSIKPKISKSEDGKRMDITFQIHQGELVYIDRITIKGNTRTRDNVIRRELRIAEGGVFDSRAIRESTQALQRLQFFEEVNITPEPSLNPDRMNVIIEVKEKSTGSFSIGVGYSSADNLIVMGQIAENNFLGRGDTLSLSANIGGKSSRYNLAYTNPHLNDSPLSWGIDLFNTRREYDNYTRESKGGGVRIGYPIWEKWRIYGNYSFNDTDLSDVSENASYIIRNSVDIHTTSSLKISLIRDTKNRRFGASSGSRNVFSVRYAGGPLGGDAQFTKIQGSTSWYFPMVWNTVLHVKAAAGQVFENESNKLPVYERFYLGGLNSVRGFEYAKISPIDTAAGERIGGDRMWYTNTEVIFPLLQTQGLMGVVFYDTGQVLDDDEDFSESNDSIKQAAGLGIRWLSPMGPLRMAWGYNLDPLEDEDESVWDFSVGGTF